MCLDARCVFKARRTILSFTILAISIVVIFSAFSVQAQQTISSDSERGAAALGHYARTRALIVEALAEFELGRRIADPDMILDSEQWRMTLISRAEELNRILDPKPRITRSGVRYKANSRSLREDRTITPEDSKNFPKDSTTPAEEASAKILKSYPAKAIQPTSKAQTIVPEKTAVELKKPQSIKEATVSDKEDDNALMEEEGLEEEITTKPQNTKGNIIVEKEDKNAKKEEILPEAKKSTIKKEDKTEEVKNTESVFNIDQEGKTEPTAEDVDIDQAIEAVIQEKLQKIDTTSGK